MLTTIILRQFFIQRLYSLLDIGKAISEMGVGQMSGR